MVPGHREEIIYAFNTLSVITNFLSRWLYYHGFYFRFYGKLIFDDPCGDVYTIQVRLLLAFAHNASFNTGVIGARRFILGRMGCSR